MASVVDKEDFSKAVICRRTRESEAGANDMVEESEAWSPVFNLIKDAGGRIEMVWIRDVGDFGVMVA